MASSRYKADQGRTRASFGANLSGARKAQSAPPESRCSAHLAAYHSLTTHREYTEIRKSRGRKRPGLEVCDFYPCVGYRQVLSLQSLRTVKVQGLRCADTFKRRTHSYRERHDEHTRISTWLKQKPIPSTQLYILLQYIIVTSGHTRRQDGQHCTYFENSPSFFLPCSSLLFPPLVDEEICVRRPHELLLCNFSRWAIADSLLA